MTSAPLRDRNGLVFSILILSFTVSLILMFLSFSLFLSDTETSVFDDTVLGTQFSAVEHDFSEIIDLKTEIEKDPTFTTINFTDRIPRTPGFQDNLQSYESFLKNQLNLSYNTTADFSAFISQPHIKIRGTKGIYNYSSDEKQQLNILQKDSNTSFVKEYNLTVQPRESGYHRATVTPQDESNSGNLEIIIRARNDSGVLDTFQQSVPRDNATQFIVGFDGPGKAIEEVDIIAGEVNGFNSSISVDPTFNISITTLLKLRDSEIPD